MCPLCVIQMSSNLSSGQEISVEFLRTVRKYFLPNSAEFPKRFDLERYFRTFPQNFRTFPQDGKIVWEYVKKTTLYGNARHCMEIGGKKHLCMEMCGIVCKSVRKITLYGNVQKSDLVKIWFELASQLDLNCSENVKKN